MMKTSRLTLVSLIARAESAIGLGDFDAAATLIADARTHAHNAYPSKYAQEALVDLARLRVELTLAARATATAKAAGTPGSGRSAVHAGSIFSPPVTVGPVAGVVA